MENYSHHHDNGNVSNRTSMGIDLFNTNLYRDGRQISNRQEDVHKRGGLKIK
jgi:hypothetical protein